MIMKPVLPIQSFIQVCLPVMVNKIIICHQPSLFLYKVDEHNAVQQVEYALMRQHFVGLLRCNAFYQLFGKFLVVAVKLRVQHLCTYHFFPAQLKLLKILDALFPAFPFYGFKGKSVQNLYMRGMGFCNANVVNMGNLADYITVEYLLIGPAFNKRKGKKFAKLKQHKHIHGKGLVQFAGNSCKL